MRTRSIHVLSLSILVLAGPVRALEKVAEPVVAAQSARTGCTPSAQVMCLNQGRFQVETTWQDGTGRTGHGMVVPGGADDSGLFWFFKADNWEVLVKVLDGCAVNDHYWVFAAATTDVQYTLTVRDTQSTETAQYTNPLGTAADAITDTGAFQTCP